MKVWAQHIFDSPRSDGEYNENRDRVGSFIYQKLASSGLMMLADTFQYVGVAMSSDPVAQQKPMVRNIWDHSSLDCSIWHSFCSFFYS